MSSDGGGDDGDDSCALSESLSWAAKWKNKERTK